MSLARLSALRLLRPAVASCTMNRFYAGEAGSGVGMGGGTGGSIRDAGGSFGKREHALEEEYFRRLQAEQLKALKKHHDEEIEAHEREIQRHEDAINRLKKRKTEIKQDHSDSDTD